MRLWLGLLAWGIAVMPTVALAAHEPTTARATTTGASCVERWGVFNQPFPGPVTGGPFFDIELSAKFSCGNKALTVHRLYDGDGIYRIRFMPGTEGRWSFVMQSNRPTLSWLVDRLNAVRRLREITGP